MLTELCPGYTPTPVYAPTPVDTPTPVYTPTPSPVTYTLTMAADPVDGGTTSPAVGAHPDDYTAGAVENITAAPNSGYHFNHWSSNVADPDSASTTVTMDGDKTVTANFSAIDYTVSLSVIPPGSGTTTGAGTYNVGDSVQIETAANSGYAFVNWTDDDNSGAEVSANATYNFTMPAVNVTLTANFRICNEHDSYGVSSSYSYDADAGDAGQTTFTYTVWEKESTCTCKEIEKIKLEFGNETWADDVSISMNVVDGDSTFEEKITDKEIKMDKLQPGFIAGTITITFDGDVGAVDGTLNIKAQGPGNDWDFDVDKPNI